MREGKKKLVCGGGGEMEGCETFESVYSWPRTLTQPTHVLHIHPHKNHLPSSELHEKPRWEDASPRVGDISVRWGTTHYSGIIVDTVVPSLPSLLG